MTLLAKSIPSDQIVIHKSDEGAGGNDTRLLCRYESISAGNMQID